MISSGVLGTLPSQYLEGHEGNDATKENEQKKKKKRVCYQGANFVTKRVFKEANAAEPTAA